MRQIQEDASHTDGRYNVETDGAGYLVEGQDECQVFRGNARDITHITHLSFFFVFFNYQPKYLRVLRLLIKISKILYFLENKFH